MKRFIIPLFMALIGTISLLLSLLVRFRFDITEILRTEYLAFKIFLCILIYLSGVYLSDLYKWTVIRNEKEYLFRLFQALAISIIIYAIIYALLPQITTGRGIFTISLLIAALILVFLPRFYRFLLKIGAFSENIVILGTGKMSQSIARELLLRSDFGYNLLGLLSPTGEEVMGENTVRMRIKEGNSGQMREVPVLGGMKNLKAGIEGLGVEQIVVALEERRIPGDRRKGERRKGERRRVNIPLSYLNLPEDRRRGEDIKGHERRSKERRGGERRSEGGGLERGSYMVELLKLKVGGVKVVEGSRFYEALTGKVYIGVLTPSWFLFSETFELNKISLIVKNIFERFFAVLVLLMVSPLLLFTSLVILLDSGWPVFFVQVRTGRNGIPFKLIKFRSMSQGENSEERGSQKGSVTLFGKFMRRYRIDELPQLINILMGEMSLVGPRPEQPHFIERFTKEIPFYELRLMVKPGMTGWAQVMYPVAKAEDAWEKLQYDLFYIKNFSIFNDLIILLETVKVLFLGRK